MEEHQTDTEQKKQSTQGNRTITEYVAQFRQLISLQEAAGCPDSEATYVERLISNLHSALVPEAHKFLAEYVVLQRHRQQPSADHPRPMFDALVEYLTQRNLKDHTKYRTLHMVAKVPPRAKGKHTLCSNCGENSGTKAECKLDINLSTYVASESGQPAASCREINCRN